VVAGQAAMKDRWQEDDKDLRETGPSRSSFCVVGLWCLLRQQAKAGWMPVEAI
jgi:hypothetical protein